MQSPRARSRLLGIGEPIGRVLGQAAQHDALQILGNVRTDLRRGYHWVAHWAISQPNSVVPVEGRTPGQEVISDRAERIDIAPPVDLLIAAWPAPAT